MTPPDGVGSEPTLGELLRRLDAVSQQLVAVAERLERRDSYIEENFIRRQVWIEARKGDQAMVANLAQDIGALQSDRKKDVESQRQRNFAMAVLAISTMVSIALGIAGILAR